LEDKIMANIPEPVTPGFPSVHQWDFDDDVIGGPEGVATLPIQQLVERDANLKNKIEREADDREEADAALQQQVDAVKGRGGYLTASDFGDFSQIEPEEIQVVITAYALSQIHQTDPELIWNGTHVKNLFDSHVWALTNTPDTEPAIFEWVDDGFDSISQARNDGTLGVVAGDVEDPVTFTTDGNITVLPGGKQKVIGFNRLVTQNWLTDQRPVGKVEKWLIDLTAAEMVKYRQLPLNGQLILVSQYADLCARKYVGNSLNDSAKQWYRCNVDGSRNTSGAYMRVQNVQGLFFRAAGSQTLTVTWTDSSGAVHSVNTLYDGKSIGGTITDAIRDITGNITSCYPAIFPPDFGGALYAVDWGVATAAVNKWDAWGNIAICLDAARDVPTDTTNHPASVSVSVYISY
jgi:hypothetical protein